MSARETILKRLRQAQQEKQPTPYPEVRDAEDLFVEAEQDLTTVFAAQLQAVQGYFYTCEDSNDFIQQLQALMQARNWSAIQCEEGRLLHLLNNFGPLPVNQAVEKQAETILLTSCVQLIARTGSILFSSKQAAGRLSSISADIHLVLAHQNQLVFSIKQALLQQTKTAENWPSMLSLTTGASRTADIEKTLVMGAHGPRELHVFLVKHLKFPCTFSNLISL